MADLLTTIKRNGQLQQVTSQEASQLAGRPSAPTQPLETAVLGTSPDVAKMAGTPNQLAASARMDIEGPQDLATVLRRQQAKRAASAQEEQQIKSGRFLEESTLGDLGGRVASIAESLLGQAAEGQQDVELGVTADDSRVGALLNTIRDNPQDVESIAQLYQLMGVEQASQLVAADGSMAPAEKNRIISQFDTTSPLGQALNKSLDEALGDGDFSVEDLGFDDLDEVATTLGVSAEQLANMTVQDLQEKVNREIDLEFNQVEALQRQVSNPNLGAAERAEARQALRELGAVGIRSVESDLDDLADELQQANMIDFMGEKVDVNQVMDNEYVSGLAAQYFADPEFASRMAQEEPELAEFLDRHKNVLEQRVTEIGEGLGQFARLNYDNLNLGKIEGAGALSEEAMKAMYPDYGKIRATRYQPNALLQTLKQDMPTTQKAAIVAETNNLIKTRPQLAKDIGRLSQGQLDSLGLTQPMGARYQQFQKALEQKDRLANLSDRDSVANVLVPGMSSQDLVAKLQEAYDKQQSGFFEESGPLAELLQIAPDKDPRRWNNKDWQQIAANLASQGQRGSLAEYAASLPKDFSELGQKAAAEADRQDAVYSLVQDVIKDDGQIGFNELWMGPKQFSTDELEQIFRDPRAVGKMEQRDRTRELAISNIARSEKPKIDQIVQSSSNFQNIPDVLRALSADTNYEQGIKLKNNVQSVVSGLNDRAKLAKEQGNTLQAEMYKRQAENVQNKLNSYNFKQLEFNTAKRKMDKALSRFLNMPTDELARQGDKLVDGMYDALAGLDKERARALTRAMPKEIRGIVEPITSGIGKIGQKERGELLRQFNVYKNTGRISSLYKAMGGKAADTAKSVGKKLSSIF